MAELVEFARNHCADHPLSLGLEVKEIQGITLKRNNIHDLLKHEAEDN